MLDTGSEETLISKQLYSELGFKGVPVEVLLITADGKRSMISSLDTSLSIGPVDNSHIRFEINNALVLNDMPSIDKNFPTSENLNCFENAYDLIKNGKFPILSDKNLHVIVGIREASLINYDRVRTPDHSDQPYLARCKLGWTAFGSDPSLKSRPLTRCNLVRTSDELLEKKIDVLLHESFAERPHDFNSAPSVNDKIVLEKYKDSIKCENGRYQISLPFKKDIVEVPNNYSYALNRMLKLDQRFKKNEELRIKYFKFMGDLFSNGYAVTVDKSEAENFGKIWYQSHFCVTTSNKFRVVFDCSAKFQGVCVNDFLYKGPTMRNSLVGVLMRFRTYLCALISDIRKLYYQCEVQKDQQDFLRFLWYEDNDFNKAIIKSKMTRLSFGLLPAQSAALYCLEKNFIRKCYYSFTLYDFDRF